jgi:hypothetical protein
VLVAAALCPAPPLLARELTGGSPVVPELRQACRDAVAAALSPRPDLVAVIGTAAETGAWDAATEADLAAFAPALHAANAGPAAADGGGGTLPVALGLGGRLLDQAGYRGRRVLHAVSEDLPPADCAALGARLAELDARVTLVVMADGSARRTLKAPGYLDERSGPFDAAAERALRSGDLASLLDLDAALARELMATGRPGWHVLAGAARGVRAVCEVGYRGDPFGVFYLAATLAFTHRR